jgi:MFS family permease
MRTHRTRRGPAAAAAHAPIPREAWGRLAACTAAAALLQIDGTLITVALPTAAHGLHVSGAFTSTVLSAYFVEYASSVLVLVAVLVGAAAPVAGRLVDRHGERLTATAGFLLVAVGLAILSIPGLSLRSVATVLPRVVSEPRFG